MSVNVLYKTSARATGGRDGRAATLDGSLDVKLTTPKELGGAGGAGNNPEQLFAAGYASCFNGAIMAVAKGRNVEGSEVTARVTFGKSEAGGFGLAVTLEVKLPNLPADEAMHLVEEAHQVCPYSVATRGNIEVTLKVA